VSGRSYRSRRDAGLPRSFPARVIPGVGRRDAGRARAPTFALLVVDVPVLTGADIVTVTLTAKRPAAEYVCRPITVKLPSSPLTVPRLMLPSPQRMIATKLPAAVKVFASVNVATAPMNGDLLAAAMFKGWADKESTWASVSALADALAGESPAPETARTQ
jgi:hypothetical protein